METEQTPTYDVIVLGGALAGAAAALLLRRHLPGLRVLIVERNPAFDWKVGESTVEISSYFLTRVLRLYDYLSREQLPKHGLRYWFHNGKVSCLRDSSETGVSQLPRLPSFQLDRAKLDEHVHSLAVKEGAEVWRPAKIVDVRLPEETPCYSLAPYPWPMGPFRMDPNRNEDPVDPTHGHSCRERKGLLFVDDEKLVRWSIRESPRGQYLSKPFSMETLHDRMASHLMTIPAPPRKITQV